MRCLRVFRNADRTLDVRLEGADRDHARQFEGKQYEDNDKYERNYRGQSFEPSVEGIGLTVKIQRGWD